MKKKLFTIALALILAIGLSSSGTCQSKKPAGSSSSKPSSSSSRSSKPSSSSSKPSSKFSSPSSKPPSSKPPSSSKPSSKFSSPSSKPSAPPPSSSSKPSSKFSSPSSKPSAPPSSSKPSSKFSSPSTPPPSSSSKPSNKFSSPSVPPSSKPSTSNDSTSRKPKTSINTNSDKSEAAKQESSRRIYVESQKATAPPKSTYTTPEGRTVNVRPNSSTNNTIRNNPSSYYNPEIRTQRTETHIHTYHYQHPSSWYYSQSPIYIGGGYNSAFWWMMSEWSAERRAQWLYHNQNVIERDAYERGLKDAAVAARIAELNAQNAQINPDYVDPEFANDPSIMYTQDHIEAVYNPEISNVELWTLLIVLGVVVLCVPAYFLMFQVRWGK